MAEKSLRKTAVKKQGKSLKEKRANKKEKKETKKGFGTPQ